MVCPPSVTVNAAANACSAVVSYTTPTVNCSNCTSSTQTFNYTGVMQNFVVPAGVTSINILARGAQGGKHASSTFSPGLGAGMRGTFIVTPGQTLKVLVGECPSITTGGGNGGGGGSFVTTLANVPMIIAGGGGGSCLTTSSTARDGNVTTTGGTGAAGGGTGGTAGNGGNVGGAGFQSGAGGGLLTNGATGWAAGSGGISYIGGGAGGLVAAWAFARGGYGGGGQGSAFVVGGGGGGYSGGGSGGHVGPGGGNGGGGGSYNIGTCQSNTTGINVGHGSVVFSWGTSTVVPVLTAGLASGSNFPVGTTVQTYTAGDSFGNTTSCSVTVTVTDVTTPTITCPANVSQCSAIVTGIAPVLVLDNCPTAPAVTYSFSGVTAGSGANNASGSTFNVGNTTVTYIATDPSGNVGSCSFVVTAGVSPTISSTTTNSVICLGGSTTLNGVGAATYTWSGGVTNGVPFSPTITTTYTLTGTSASGCTNTAVRTITVNPLPVIITNSPTACVGSNINLTSNGGTGYSWSGPLGYTSLLQNPVIGGATTAMSGVYTVTVTSAAGCSATANASVTVVNTPTATLVSNSPVCLGSTLSFTAGGGTINLTGPNGFASAATNASIPGVTALANGVYTLIVTAGTCTASTTSAVVINPLPVPLANSNSPVCVGQPINFTGAGGTTYTWTGPGSYSSTTQNPIIATAQATNAGVYTLSVTNANGCKNSVTTNVVINPLPVIVTNSPIACVNTNINLTSNGGTGYSWSGPLGYTSLVQNPVIANATTGMSGIYTVTVTTAAGCTATANASVTVVTLPVAVLNSNSPVCLGGALTFTASGGTINLTGPNGFLSAVANSTITNVTALANGIYTLIVSAGSCTASTTASVTINPLPVPLAGSNSPVCVGQPINFTGNGGTGYAWSGPGAYSSGVQNPTIAVASSTNAGVYTLTVTNANGCTNTITTNVAINPLPVIAPLNNPTVCLNTNINLGANGGTGYAWTGPNAFVSGVQNPVIANATAAMAGPYTVVVTSALGCTNSAISTVAVLPLPTPVIINNTPCVGSALNLNGSGGATYGWNGPNGFINATQNPTITNVTLAANGTYTLVATVGTCTASITQVITVNPLPVPVAANNAPICATGNVVLTGNGGGNYSWTGPLGFTSAVQNPTITNALSTHSGNYILTVTDANGCQASATTSVNVLANPAALANGVTVCFGQPGNLTANGGVSYAWSGPNGFSSNLQNPTIPVVNNLTTGNYNVIVTGANTCTSSTTANVIANTLPVPTITSTAKACVNNPISLQGSTGFLLNQWTGPNNFLSPNANTSFTTNSTSQSGIYVFSVTDANGCTGSTSTLVTVDPLPVGTLVSDGKSSCVPFCANFSVNNSITTSTIVNVSWSINNQTFVSPLLSYCFNIGGNYPVKASFTDNNGCANTTTFAISAYNAPRADFEFSPLKPVEGIDNVMFTNTSTGTNTAWHWYFTNLNGYNTSQQNTSYLFQEPGTYAVAMVVTNKWGCSDTVVKAIDILEDQTLFVPNSFTPNGDGLNEIFQPKGKGFAKFNMQVFNRWGQKIYETNEFTGGWDGTFQGKECQQDSYVWKITVTYPQSKVKQYTGHVTLNR
ncbi:MAG: gliding motility-associated C-terminal domain-containing protein [Bacteroidota bacterium]|nr:gliding motility-associated C-terminal domain-containing protein [Bacteroidota bacterium]